MTTAHGSETSTDEAEAEGAPAERPLRADARRNRERILRAAEEMVAARGVDVSVDEIAVASALAPEQVLGPLAILEMAGLARRDDGRWRIVRPGSRHSAAGSSTARLV